ncbi:hypothetical protein QL285_049826 [Trifolium repens]|jgi:hypothetical protein|nr:hypothetical protein QL285_049826 [Trifolium repens]
MEDRHWSMGSPPGGSPNVATYTSYSILLLLTTGLCATLHVHNYIKKRLTRVKHRTKFLTPTHVLQDFNEESKFHICDMNEFLQLKVVLHNITLHQCILLVLADLFIGYCREFYSI